MSPADDGGAALRGVGVWSGKLYATSPLPWPATASPLGLPPWPAADLVTRMAWGELPGIVSVEESLRAELLRSYCMVYLAEELRREALVRNWAAFSRFLRLAALESGQIVNYAHIAQQAGVSQLTVKSHYELLEDMSVGFPVPAFSGSARKGLLSTPRFYFFDLGVRLAAAGLTPSRHHAITPSRHHAITPSRHHAITPSRRKLILGRSFSNGWAWSCGNACNTSRTASFPTCAASTTRRLTSSSKKAAWRPPSR